MNTQRGPSTTPGVHADQMPVIQPGSGASRSTRESQRGRFHYLDVCRTLAVCAVIVLHVASRKVELYNKIPKIHWQITNFFDSVVRWGVPVFIMISGALLIGPVEEFNAVRYIRRRFLKVMIPFLAWSVIYAAWAANGSDFLSIHYFNRDVFLKSLSNIPTHRTYIHLEFFYYFIPLYFVIPLLSFFESRRQLVLFYLCGWLLLCLLRLLNVGSILNGDIFMYSGYLLAGHYIHQYNLMGRKTAGMLLLGSLLATIIGTALVTWAHGELDQLFYSYKSLNVAVGALCVVQLVKYYCNAPNRVFSLIARYSMGIYLIHILFLKVFEFYIPVFSDMNPALTVPVCFAFTFSTSLLAAWIISRIPLIRHITP